MDGLLQVRVKEKVGNCGGVGAGADAGAAGVRSSHRTEKVAPGIVWYGM